MVGVWLLVLLVSQSQGSLLSLRQDIIDHVSSRLKITPFGISDDIAAKINETVVSVAPMLKDLPIRHAEIKTGESEIGNIIINLENGVIKNMDNIVAEIIDFTVFPIALKNLTLHWDTVDINCNNYSVSGFMNFPLNNQKLPLSGSGSMSVTVTNLRISVYIKFGYNSTVNGIAVKDINADVTAEAMQVHFENLFYDEELSWAFNTVISDVSVIVLDYLKMFLIPAVLPYIEEAINEILHPSGLK